MNLGQLLARCLTLLCRQSRSHSLHPWSQEPSEILEPEVLGPTSKLSRFGDSLEKGPDLFPRCGRMFGRDIHSEFVPASDNPKRSFPTATVTTA